MLDTERGADLGQYPGGFERNFLDAEPIDPPAPAVGIAARISNHFAPPEVRDTIAIAALFAAVIAGTVGGFLLFPWLGCFLLAAGLLLVAFVYGTGD